MKKIIQNKGLTLCIAVSETTDTDSNVAFGIYETIQSAIDNDGCVIYNGNDETVEVPFLARLRQMHPDFVDGTDNYNGPFEGWDNVLRIFAIDGARCSQEQFIQIVCQKFSPEIVECWHQSLQAAQEHSDFPVFLGSDCAAIHCDCVGDTWFEYIITKHAEAAA